MITFTLVTGFLISLIILGIWISNRAAVQEEQRLRREAKIRKLRIHSMDIEDLINNLRPYEKNPDLLRILVSYLISENEKRYGLDPNISESLDDLERSKLLLDDINAHSNSDEESGQATEPTNDHEVVNLRRYLAKAIRVLKHLKVHNEISETVYLGHSNRLKHKALFAEVNAYLSQGDKCKESQDNMAAATYYKHAKEILVASDLQFEGKMTEIKRIAKLISGIYATDQKEKQEDLEGDTESESHLS